MMKGWKSFCWLAAVATAALGCRGGYAGLGRTEPVTTAQPERQARFGSAAVAEAARVRMTVAFGEYEAGAPEAGGAVPVRVRIENNSDRPLRLRYSEFKVQTAAGREYGALPPHRLGKRPRAPVPIAGEFEHEGFALAPYYREHYDFGADLPLWDGPFEREPGYHDDYFSVWEENLPTLGMQRAAMPEGVVRPGGAVSGQLYFQPVPEGTTHVSYRAALVDADSGEPMGEISIPFARP